MEEELEEEQGNSEAAQEKARKAQQQADTLSSELSTLQSNYNQSESNRMSLEKQVTGQLMHVYMYVHEGMVFMYK